MSLEELPDTYVHGYIHVYTTCMGVANVGIVNVSTGRGRSLKLKISFYM